MDTKTSPHILVVDDHREIRELKVTVVLPFN